MEFMDGLLTFILKLTGTAFLVALMTIIIAFVYEAYRGMFK